MRPTSALYGNRQRVIHEVPQLGPLTFYYNYRRAMVPGSLPGAGQRVIIVELNRFAVVLVSYILCSLTIE